MSETFTTLHFTSDEAIQVYSFQHIFIGLSLKVISAKNTGTGVVATEILGFPITDIAVRAYIYAANS